NILAAPLRQGRISEGDLRAVQRRREFPTRATQAMQVFIQNRVIGQVLESTEKLSPPFLLRLFGVDPVPVANSRPADRSRLSPRTCEYPRRGLMGRAVTA